MSGSPVLYYGSNVHGSASGQWVSEVPFVVGVYSGREGVTAAEDSMALGRVWKAEVLDSILSESGRRRGVFRGIGGAARPAP
jgi:hypothetical protein